MWFWEILAIVVIWLSFWSLIPRDEWWFRAADFPRLQLLGLGGCALLGLVYFRYQWTALQIILLFLLVIALSYQLRMVLPYTFIWSKQVKQVAEDALNPEQQIALLVSNVLTPNRNYHLLIQHIQRLQPDIVLTLESDAKWQQALAVIEQDYPYRVNVPLDNLYGMHLYSKLQLVESKVKFMLSEEIPSIHTRVILRSGQSIQLYCLHPKPPSPTEARESTLRDAELLLIGDSIKDSTESNIVMGDLNDVAWSRTTQLFQRISGLLDPRVGRKFINTFHAKWPFLRWSLDHVFHSTDFALVKMYRLPSIGSDHFPVFTVLQAGEQFDRVQQEVQETISDQQEAREKIKQGIDKSNK